MVQLCFMLFLGAYIMKDSTISIDTAVFQKITEGIAGNGAECLVENTVLNHARQTVGTDIGQKLFSYLEELCECSELYKIHNSEVLPSSLNNIMNLMIEIDNKDSSMIKNLKR